MSRPPNIEATAVPWELRDAEAARAKDVGHDIEQIAAYLPYVDVLIADRFFAQIANERYVGINRYRGQIQPLGEKHIPKFIGWIESLVSAAPHVAFADRLYEDLARRGSWRRFTDRVGWTEPEVET